VIPLRLVETDREDFDEPVVELWRDDEFVGFVFWDDGPIVQIFKDRDEDVFDLDVHDLLRILDVAERIVTPGDDALARLKDTIKNRITVPGSNGADDDDDDWDDDDDHDAPDAAVREAEPTVGAAHDEEPSDDDWEGEDPAVFALASEFDGLAVHRSDESEGYFDRETAGRLIARCDQLDLAVSEMEAFDLEGPILMPRPNLSLVVEDTLGAGWPTYRRHANSVAADTLRQWPTRPSLVVAFVVQTSDGDDVVM
jgi:hypothetical protein